jgi:hypothetical protein
VARRDPAADPPGTARRVRRAGAGQVSADPGPAAAPCTLHPDQRALPVDELAAADAVYGYSFVVTNLDVSTGERAAAVEHWYRHRTSIETAASPTTETTSTLVSG